MNKIEQFETEINYIKSDRIKNNAKVMINLLPDYFFSIPASSTGKYHPNYALGEGGLLRHTRAAVKIANELLYNNHTITSFTDDEKDLIIFTLLIHDGLKSGIVQEKYTRFDHPILISSYLAEVREQLDFKDEEIKRIQGALESHMGEWNQNDYQAMSLPLPKGSMEKFVHICDFLASRKFIEIIL